RTAQERDRAIDAEKEARKNLETAEANLKLAKQAVNDTFDVAKNNAFLQQQGMHEVRKVLLAKALPFYKRFRGLRGDDARSRAELADHLHRVGLITSEIGDKGEARQAYQQEAQHLRSLAKDHPGVPGYRHKLAMALINVGTTLQEEGKRGEVLKAYTQ